ncbi:hypothetical protein SAY87_015160 [Trapa incisa]|uniref:General transcription and DNA repair factor IIH subunit TFB5 n=1 Tax=Trapa incisa TaxID=236973 RepID=A0AAN7H0P6_9MYRT|nr:hypothetical protein SAY87_015160 [Trapa incisa]
MLYFQHSGNDIVFVRLATVEFSFSLHLTAHLPHAPSPSSFILQFYSALRFLICDAIFRSLCGSESGFLAHNGQCYKGTVHLMVDSILHIFRIICCLVIVNDFSKFSFFLVLMKYPSRCCSDIPMAQFIINYNGLHCRNSSYVCLIAPTQLFVQPHAAQMIRSSIAEFREQNSYEKPA